MPWNSTSPLGSVSVKANETIGQQNTTYIETTMGNSIVGTNTVSTRDHFWNVGSDEDGRHRFIQSPAFTSTAPAPNNIYPALGSGMASVTFSLLKSVAESPAQQDVQPFFRNASAIMQILGIRACAAFGVSAGVVTVEYSHNITSVVRSSAGIFTVNYTTNLPSNKYLVFTNAIRNSSTGNNQANLFISASTTINPVKSPAKVELICTSTGGSLIDPLEAFVVCFGG